ncbi:hypothetical protein Y032_0027g1558 [Ancylostoma ceylanicum]|uniref:Uncharacterized protein n=1 Tax=Ancylostoma ceylanicum TaxID=53326 RepID=A0A016UU90_9BILA|nr:hypothetical protein Y032_0027g1558 [Ancylostoma ceylanicum]
MLIQAYPKIFSNACASSITTLGGRRRTFAPTTHPHASAARHLVRPVVALAHGFTRASAGLTSPAGLALSPPRETRPSSDGQQRAYIHLSGGGTSRDYEEQERRWNAGLTAPQSTGQQLAPLMQPKHMMSCNQH